MSKLKVYLDTSVISYLEQVDAPEQMKVTCEVWETFKKGDYDIFISDVVIRELTNCSDEEKRKRLLSHLTEIEYNVVNVTKETVVLAEQIIDFWHIEKAEL